MAEERKLIRYEDVYRYAFGGVHGGGLEDEEFDAIINAIDAVDAVDAVEVVRCKACKQWKAHNINGKEPFGRCGKLFAVMRCDGFCSYGERKDDERKAD